MVWTTTLNFFVAVLALVDPLGNALVFLGYVRGDTALVRRKLALLIAVTVFVLLLGCMFAGQAVLAFFGISLPAFRIAGGILLLLMGIGMLTGRQEEAPGPLPAFAGETPPPVRARDRLPSILVPVAVPLMVGPGTMSTVILYAARAEHGVMMLGFSLALASVAVLIAAAFLAAERIQFVLGRAGQQIITRILGLLLTAIAVQFFIDGLAEATVGFIHMTPEVTNMSSGPIGSAT